MRVAGLHAKPVLVVEDNNDVREMIRVLLELEGYTVVTAADGTDAIATLRRGLNPCVIILDLTMPGKDGYQVRQEQLQDSALAAIPVIVCSGDIEVAAKAKALGAVGYYHKPIEVDGFLGIVARYC